MTIYWNTDEACLLEKIRQPGFQHGLTEHMAGLLEAARLRFGAGAVVTSARGWEVLHAVSVAAHELQDRWLARVAAHAAAAHQPLDAPSALLRNVCLMLGDLLTPAQVLRSAKRQLESFPATALDAITRAGYRAMELGDETTLRRVVKLRARRPSPDTPESTHELESALLRACLDKLHCGHTQVGPVCAAIRALPRPRRQRYCRAVNRCLPEEVDAFWCGMCTEGKLPPEVLELGPACLGFTAQERLRHRFPVSRN
jgi:hypothetical protein